MKRNEGVLLCLCQNHVVPGASWLLSHAFSDFLPVNLFADGVSGPLSWTRSLQRPLKHLSPRWASTQLKGLRMQLQPHSFLFLHIFCCFSASWSTSLDIAFTPEAKPYMFFLISHTPYIWFQMYLLNVTFFSLGDSERNISGWLFLSGEGDLAKKTHRNWHNAYVERGGKGDGYRVKIKGRREGKQMWEKAASQQSLFSAPMIHCPITLVKITIIPASFIFLHLVFTFSLP